MALDIGPATIAHYSTAFPGPDRRLERPVKYSSSSLRGTVAVAEILADLPDAITVIGGDSAAASRRA